MKTPLGRTPNDPTNLAALAKSLKTFFSPTRGRREIDIPELSTEELFEIDRKNLSKKQRERTPRVKPMGRPKKYPDKLKQCVVYEVRRAVNEGATLTYSDIQMGSAFEIASEQLYGSKLSAEQIRYIWRHYKKQIA